MVKKVKELFEEADTDKDGSLSLEEFIEFSQSIEAKYPQMSAFVDKLEELFERFDKNNDKGNNIIIILIHVYLMNV